MKTAGLNSEMIKRLTTAVNTFSLELLQGGARPESNCFLSPYSIYTALSILFEGAGGKTRETIARVLGVADIDAPQLSASLAALRAVLREPEPVNRIDSLFSRKRKPESTAYDLQMANGLWTHQDVELAGNFGEVIRRDYGGETRSADFRSGKTPGQINQWVRQHTGGKISRIIDQLDPRSLLLLINTIYFKGTWLYPFDSHLTATADFFLPAGRKKRLPMMHGEQAEALAYHKTSELEIVRLPYRWGRMGMYILLPGRSNTVAGVLRKLDLKQWQDYRSCLQEKKGRVVLPRFELDYVIQLNDALEHLGLGAIFDAQKADFSRMIRGDRPLAIDEVHHKTRLKINETGTEAAAVTSFAVVFGGMMHPPQPFHMIVDRPFLLLIEDAVTKLLLFAGTIHDPES